MSLLLNCHFVSQHSNASGSRNLVVEAVTRHLPLMYNEEFIFKAHARANITFMQTYKSGGANPWNFQDALARARAFFLNGKCLAAKTTTKRQKSQLRLDCVLFLSAATVVYGSWRWVKHSRCVFTTSNCRGKIREMTMCICADHIQD